MWLLKPDFCLYVRTYPLYCPRLQLSVLFVTFWMVLVSFNLFLASRPHVQSRSFSPPPPSVLLSSQVFPSRYRFSQCHSAKNCEYRKNGCSGSHMLYKNVNEYGLIFCIFHPILEMSLQSVFRNNILCTDFVEISRVMLWEKVDSDRQQFSNEFKWNYSYYIAF